MLFTYWVTESLDVSSDLTDVTLVREDTWKRLDWCDSGEWWYLKKTWLMWRCLLETWLLWVRMPSRDLTGVTLVSEDEGCLLIKVGYWWKLSIDKSLLMKVVNWRKMSIDESCLLMKVFHWWNLSTYLWKLSFDESCLLMKPVYLLKLPIDESCLFMKVYLLAPLGALIVSPFRDPVPSAFSFDCSNLFNMALADQTRPNENLWNWMRVDDGVWRWMKVGESGWKWMKVDESGWKWMKGDESVLGFAT